MRGGAQNRRAQRGGKLGKARHEKRHFQLDQTGVVEDVVFFGEEDESARIEVEAGVFGDLPFDAGSFGFLSIEAFEIGVFAFDDDFGVFVHGIIPLWFRKGSSLTSCLGSIKRVPFDLAL